MLWVGGMAVLGVAPSDAGALSMLGGGMWLSLVDVSIGMVVSVGLKPIRSIAASESDMTAVSSRYHH